MVGYCGPFYKRGAGPSFWLLVQWRSFKFAFEALQRYGISGFLHFWKQGTPGLAVQDTTLYGNPVLNRSTCEVPWLQACQECHLLVEHASRAICIFAFTRFH
jgi:hypothetical protein